MGRYAIECTFPDCDYIAYSRKDLNNHKKEEHAY